MPTPDCADNAITAGESVRIEIIHASPDKVWNKVVCLPPSATVNDALIHSGFFEYFPDYSPTNIHVGVYGQICTLDRALQHNDRVEIYRPLIFDPMESRRRRARHRQQAEKQGKM